MSIPGPKQRFGEVCYSAAARAQADIARAGPSLVMLSADDIRNAAQSGRQADRPNGGAKGNKVKSSNYYALVCSRAFYLATLTLLTPRQSSPIASLRRGS
jgi:hypothetical protein